MNPVLSRPGISQTTLAAAEIKFCDHPEPGSIEIRYWTAEGQLTPFSRYRLPNARADGQKYHQEPGSGVYLYYPPGHFRRNGLSRFGLAADAFFLPEGEFKALSLLESGVWAVGIPSFTVYQRDENGNRQLLRDLQVTLGKEKPSAIYYLGDNDTCTNFEFSRNAEFLASAVNPTKVFLPRIPIDQPKGIDDCKDALGTDFDIFFADLIQTAIELPRKIKAPAIAFMLLDREAVALKALKGTEREKQFERIIKVCVAAERYGKSQATSRLCQLARSVMGITAAELKAAIKDLNKEYQELNNEVKKSKVKKSNGNGHEPSQGGTDKRTEYDIALIFAKQIPPLRCVGEDWYIYQNGCWNPTKKTIYRPLALSSQLPEQRTERMAHAAMSHVEGLNQVDERSLRSFYFLGKEGEIYLNCANAVLCVTKTGVLNLPHSEDYLFTKQLAANYDPEAKAETFHHVLKSALMDEADRLLFKNFIGSLLLPDSRYECVLVCYGATGTAKSTLAVGVQAALGNSVITNLTLHQICDPKCFHLNKLRHAAVNISTELNALAVSSENFKRLASGEAIDADQKYRDSATLETTCKLWFLTNDLPRFESGSDAELRRLRFLRFLKRDWQVDPSLKAKVALEADGVLLFMLAGLQDLITHSEMPLGSHKSIDTRERFRLQNDPLGTFVATKCELGPTCEETKDDLESAFNEFCDDKGIPAFRRSANLFRKLYERFPLHQFREGPEGARIRKIRGIRLKD